MLIKARYIQIKLYVYIYIYISVNKFIATVRLFLAKYKATSYRVVIKRSAGSFIKARSQKHGMLVSRLIKN